MRISVFESKQLQGVIVALRQDLPLGLRLRVERHTRDLGLPEWRSVLAQHASTKFENRVLVEAADVRARNTNVSLLAGASTATLSGGGVISTLAAGAEFGSKKHPQFRPRNRKGYVAFPSAHEFIPRMASLWAQTVVRTLHETIEKGLK